MKREILFRGKRKDTGEWIFGGIMQFNGESEICDYNTIDCSRHEVISETVSEFTGSVDNKLNKIFEDDIAYLSDAFSPRYRPIVMNEYGSWYIGHVGISFGNMKANGFVDCEIVGNIHDNPELLFVF